MKLLERVAGTTAHALRHPVASTAYAAGVVRGLAAAGLRTLSGHGEAEAPTRARAPVSPHVPTQRPDPTPLLDPGTAKAIRSEAETMQKAADPDKG